MDRQTDEHSKFSGAESNKLSAILEGVCQANNGKWEAVIADAIAAREMDSRSVETWKFCAKAGLVGGDVDAARDCLLEALHIDPNDREAYTILRHIVEEHLHKMLEVRST